MTQSPTNAVIYCRVSSTKQTTEGAGLSSQETRCREFAARKGYQVVGVFTDGVSGSLTKRPGMEAMVQFLTGMEGEAHAVIIDDISRLARGIDTHHRLKSIIAAAGGLLESPSVEFGESSDEVLVENLLASVSQHQRQKNGEQVKNRMRARVLNGFWVFQAPVGYKYEKSKAGGKVLVPDDPVASIIKEVFEGFASHRFGTQVEVKRFLDRQPAFPKPNGSLPNWRVTQLLTNPIYAGLIEVPRWNIARRDGQHEPLVSLTTFEAVQTRLNSAPHLAKRKDINDDFPLRGFVVCGDCNAPLRSCWSQGKTKTYPYYLCQTKGCGSYGKSLPRAKVEGSFEMILRRLTPATQTIQLIKAMFRDAWDQRAAQTESAQKHLRTKLKTTETEIEKLIDKLIDSTSPTLGAVLEKRLAALETQKRLTEEALQKTTIPKHRYEELLELSLQFLANPYKLWKTGHLTHQRTVLKLAFAEHFAYHRTEGPRTPNMTLPFKVLEGFSNVEESMVPRRRLELPLPFGNWHLKPARLPIPPPGQVSF